MTNQPVRHFPFADNMPKGYATYENAMKKLVAEVPASIEDAPATTILALPSGRFMPAAIGQRALSLGLHFRGIACLG